MLAEFRTIFVHTGGFRSLRPPIPKLATSGKAPSASMQPTSTRGWLDALVTGALADLPGDGALVPGACACVHRCRHRDGLKAAPHALEEGLASYPSNAWDIPWLIPQTNLQPDPMAYPGLHRAQAVADH